MTDKERMKEAIQFVSVFYDVDMATAMLDYWDEIGAYYRILERQDEAKLLGERGSD